MEDQFTRPQYPWCEYLAFDSSNYTFWATCVNAIREKVRVIWKVFINLVEDAKSSCSSFFWPFPLCFYVFVLFVCFFFVWSLVLLFFWFFVSFLFYNWNKSFHLWANCKVFSIPFYGWYWHLLSTILASRRCWR